MHTRIVTLDFAEVAAKAGFVPGPDGRLNLPLGQDTCHRLARAARGIIGTWRPEDPAVEVILTGAGPMWGQLVVAHACNGIAVRLRYVAPNCPMVTVWGHGLDAND